MLRKTVRQFGALIGMLLVVMPPICANTVDVIELECSTNPMTAQWVRYFGIPGVRYTLTSLGLIDSDRGINIAEVSDDNEYSLSETPYGLYVYVAARCMLSEAHATLSVSDSSLTCDEGEGIMINFTEPNHSNSYRYRYVVTLTKTQDKVNKSRGVAYDGSHMDLSLSEMKYLVPGIEPNGCFN